MRTIAATLVAAALMTAAPPLRAQDTYTMEDLAALMEQESWIEILDHAQDVRPSKRGRKWKRYLEAAAVGHIKSIRDTGDKARALKTADELLIRHPLLKKSRPYMDARAEVGLEALTDCFRDRNASIRCSERAETFVSLDPDNHKLAFEAGRVTRLRGSDYVAARLFARAFKHEARRKSCGEPQVKLAVRAVLSNARHEPTRDAARKIAFEYCWKDLESEILETFTNASTSYLASTCPALLKRKVLTPFQRALCEDNP